MRRINPNPPKILDYDPAGSPLPPGGSPWTYLDTIQYHMVVIQQRMRDIEDILDVLAGVTEDPDNTPEF